MRGLALIVFLFCLGACTHKDRIPSGIIDKDKMGNILWDMIQTDQFSVLYLSKDSTKKNVRQETGRMYGQVLQIHHTTKEDFEKSLQFYVSRPDISKVMFDSLAVRGNRDREKLYMHPVQLPPKLKQPFKKP